MIVIRMGVRMFVMMVVPMPVVMVMVMVMIMVMIVIVGVMMIMMMVVAVSMRQRLFFSSPLRSKTLNGDLAGRFTTTLAHDSLPVLRWIIVEISIQRMENHSQPVHGNLTIPETIQNK
jgi:hypothetical protein